MSTFDVSHAEHGNVSPHSNPSVSKSQWVNFALGKLRDGFALLQSPNGKVYQFYRVGAPLQPCTAHAAKKLLAMGLLDVTKTDFRGTHYGLRDAFRSDTPAA